MQTTLNTYTVADVCHGFTYNELEGKGLFGVSTEFGPYRAVSTFV